MLRLRTFLSLLSSGSMPARCATSFKSIAQILRPSNLGNIGHVAQNARVWGVRGLASDGGLQRWSVEDYEEALEEGDCIRQLLPLW